MVNKAVIAKIYYVSTQNLKKKLGLSVYMNKKYIQN